MTFVVAVKIAIMMLVHKNEHQAQRLINHLSQDFDVFVHIDKRSKLNIVERENVFIYKKYRAYWGSFNQIIATLYLLEKAFQKGYDRYLLISAQDLPIKTNEEIKYFFEKNDKEYLDIGKIPRSDGWPNMSRLTAYNLNDLYRGIGGKAVQKFLLKIPRKILRFLNKKVKRTLNYDFYGGSNWTNFTHNCVKKIFEYLEKDKQYIPRYKWTSCADEIFYQTIITNIEGLKIENNCLRYVDWQSGPEYPKTLRSEDYAKIILANALFARKFDEEVDKDIIDKIYQKIL